MPANSFLRNLASSDRACLVPHLTLLHVRRGQLLTTAGEPAQNVFFPVTAAVSLVVPVDDRQIEVATLGPDDVVNAGFALSASGRPVSSAVIQADGQVLACQISTLANAARNENLIAAFARAQQRLTDHSHIITACTLAHSLEARFGRWLLRARDIIGTNTLKFTQGGVADLLGVGRTYLNKTIENLHRRKVIRTDRGEVTILDPERLSRHACGCYGLIRSMYEGAAPYAAKQTCNVHSEIHVEERVTQPA